MTTGLGFSVGVFRAQGVYCCAAHGRLLGDYRDFASRGTNTQLSPKQACSVACDFAGERWADSRLVCCSASQMVILCSSSEDDDDVMMPLMPVAATRSNTPESGSQSWDNDVLAESGTDNGQPGLVRSLIYA